LADSWRSCRWIGGTAFACNTEAIKADREN
jgi:hypothetical protein